MVNTTEKISGHLKPRNTGTEQLFRNQVLEKLTRTHIAVPVTLHLIIVAVVSYYALERHTVLHFMVLFLAGALTWTLAEYCVHRFVYHTQTKNAVWLKIQYMAHGIHHHYPKDPTRLAMPPLPALVLILFFYGLFWLILRHNAIAFFPGFLFGYVLYISLHYAEHRVKSPRYGPFKKLWKYHMLHHYKYPETKAFGVSTILWDWIFGTLPDLTEKPDTHRNALF